MTFQVAGDLPISEAIGPAGLTRKITAFGSKVKHEADLEPRTKHDGHWCNTRPHISQQIN